jgi:hypothetical protein
VAEKQAVGGVGGFDGTVESVDERFVIRSDAWRVKRKRAPDQSPKRWANHYRGGVTLLGAGRRAPPSAESGDGGGSDVMIRCPYDASGRLSRCAT